MQLPEPARTRPRLLAASQTPRAAVGLVPGHLPTPGPEPEVSDPEAEVSDPEAALPDPEAEVSDPEAALPDPEAALSDPEPVYSSVRNYIRTISGPATVRSSILLRLMAFQNPDVIQRLRVHFEFRRSFRRRGRLPRLCFLLG